jgi:branched-chain amino acid transport system substrate-binding protein
LALAVLAVSAIMLQACTSTNASPSGSASTPPSASEMPSESQVAHGEPILIGGVWPVTGGLALLGSYQLHGATLAVEEINAAGGISCLDNRPLELIVGDTQGDPEVGGQESERVMDDGAVALIGALQSAVTFITTQNAARRGIPHIVDEGISDSITDRGFDNIFRITGSTRLVANKLTDILANDLDPAVGTIVIMNEDSLFGSSVGDIFLEELEGSGVEVLERIPYTASSSDLTTQIARVKEVNPDALVHVGYLTDGTLIARQAREQQLESSLIGLVSGGFSHPNFVKDLGPLANGVIDLNWGVSPNAANSAALAERYVATYPEDGWNHHALNSYVAVQVLADALERGCSTDGADLIAALKETNFSDHALGQPDPIQFDAKGENINAQPLLFQIQDEKIAIVGPPDYATDDLQWP